jgi:hypothetical protein
LGIWGVLFFLVAGQFGVDKEKQAPVSAALKKHIESGGALGICPEGQVSNSPPNMQPFRRGSFAIAIENQMPIYGRSTLSLCGCSFFSFLCLPFLSLKCAG